MTKLDLRPRCAYCNKIPRGKSNNELFKRYAPFCSYHCQEWGRLSSAMQYARSLPQQPTTQEPSA